MSTMSMNEEEQENGGTNHSKSTTKALLAAVEQYEVSTSGNSHSLCKPMLRVFEPSIRADYIVSGMTMKQQQSLIGETIKSWKKPAAKRYFSGLKSILDIVIAEEAYVPESAFQDADTNAEMEITSDENSTQCLRFIRHAAASTLLYLQRASQALSANSIDGPQMPVLPQLYDVALDLHNILLSVHDCGPESLGTRDAIMSLCEAWWLTNSMHRDTLIAQCLPLMVLHASEGTEFQKSHIRKLLKFKVAFRVVDFTSPESSSLRSLLLSVASNPLCLKMSEGKRFLASLLQDPDLTADLHLSFRAQIPEAKSSVLQAYGEVYHKAWKEATDASNEAALGAIEHQALQDLMHAVIHLSSPPMTKSVLSVLEPLHSDKKTPSVANLLYRLYGPIMWRSLSAANPLVRRNALVILELVFPLQDPFQDQTKASVAKCTAALSSALQDVDPRVRVAASATTAKVLVMFWEALPSSDIRMLLNHIVVAHASDAKSSPVRTAALEATTKLLETPQSHAVLRPLLPSLGNLVHDKVERVRVAAVRLLRKVKQVPGIRFYHVVPVDQLTARLSEEGRIHRDPRNDVANGLTALLLNSYFPQGDNVSANTQLQRTLTLLESDPNAAKVFYANLSNHLSVESIAKFIVLLLSFLKSTVDADGQREVKLQKKAKKRRRGARKSESDESDNGDQSQSLSNANLMAGLTEIACIMWESIAESLSDPENKSSRELLHQRFSEANLVSIMLHFEGRALEAEYRDDLASWRDDNLRVCSAILQCVSHLPKSSVKGIVSFVSSSFESLSQLSEVDCFHLSSHLALLVQWDLTDDVAAVLANGIDSAFQDEIGILSPSFDDDNSVGLSRSRPRRGSSQASRRTSLPALSAGTALPILDHILKGVDHPSEVVRNALFSAETGSTTLESALERGIAYTERLLDIDSSLARSFTRSEVEFLLRCCETYGRFVLHKSAGQSGGEGISKQSRGLLKWTTEKVLPVLFDSTSDAIDLHDLDLSRISNASDSLILPHSPGRMSPPKQRVNLSASPSRSDSKSADSPETTEPSKFYALAAAQSLLQASCVIFSEVLLVGGACGDDVAAHAVQWCKALEQRGHTNSDEPESRDLLPPLLRLSVQLCKSTGNMVLLKQVCTTCRVELSDDELTLVKKAVRSVIHTKGGDDVNLVEPLVKMFVESSCELRSIEGNADEWGRDVWRKPTLCIGAVFEAITSIEKSQYSLVKALVGDLVACESEGCPSVDFYARCLSFLLNSVSSNDAVARIIGDIDVDKFHEDGKLRAIVQNIVEMAH